MKETVEIELYISPETLDQLELMSRGKEGSPNFSVEPSAGFANLTRVLHWLELYDCAILTAWRTSPEKKRYDNDSDNRELQQRLRKERYGVIKMRGYYPQKGQNYSKENSFLTINFVKGTKEFIEDIRELSENYNQDCFLFKRAGKNEEAYLIGTNDDFGKGKIESIGAFKISSQPLEDKSTTKIGNKWIFTESE